MQQFVSIIPATTLYQYVFHVLIYLFPFTPIAQNVVCTYVALCFLTTKIISCPQEWKKLHMKDFLAMTNGFMHELEQPESKTRVETYESFMQQHEQPAPGTQVEG